MKKLLNRLYLCIISLIFAGMPLQVFAEERSIPVSYSTLSAMVKDLVQKKTSIELGQPNSVQTGDPTSFKLLILTFLLLLMLFFILIWGRRKNSRDMNY